MSLTKHSALLKWVALLAFQKNRFSHYAITKNKNGKHQNCQEKKMSNLKSLPRS